MHLFIFGCAGSLLLHRLSLVAVSTGYCLVTVCGLLIAVASPVVEHESSGPWASVIAAGGLSSCGSWALEHKTHLPMLLADMIFFAPWHVGSSPTVDRTRVLALVGGFLITEPVGKL